jgi:hypothetical protein
VKGDFVSAIAVFTKQVNNTNQSLNTWDLKSSSYFWWVTIKKNLVWYKTFAQLGTTWILFIFLQLNLGCKHIVFLRWRLFVLSVFIYSVARFWRLLLNLSASRWSGCSFKMHSSETTFKPRTFILNTHKWFWGRWSNDHIWRNTRLELYFYWERLHVHFLFNWILILLLKLLAACSTFS